MTVIGHKSESRTHVSGYSGDGSYSRDIYFTGASLTQLARLTRVSKNCEQFIKYQCLDSRIFRSGPPAWWVSRDSAKMTYRGGASTNGKCACGMTNSFPSLRSWRYCVGARLKFWRRSRVPKKGNRDEAVEIPPARKPRYFE